jgi:hypothetical protein
MVGTAPTYGFDEYFDENGSSIPFMSPFMHMWNGSQAARTR